MEMHLEDCLVTKRKNSSGSYFIVLDENDFSLIYPNGRLSLGDERALYDDPQDLNIEVLTAAQIIKFNELVEKRRNKKPNEFDFRGEVVAAWINHIVLNRHVHLGYCAGIAKKYDLLQPFQRQYLYQLGLRTVTPLSIDEAMELIHIMSIMTSGMIHEELCYQQGLGLINKH